MYAVDTDGTRTLVDDYGYDENDNRESLDAVAIYEARDRLISDGSVSLDYDDAGRVRSITDGFNVTTLEYDRDGGLRGVELRAGTDLTYTLDPGTPTGRRLRLPHRTRPNRSPPLVPIAPGPEAQPQPGSYDVGLGSHSSPSATTLPSGVTCRNRMHWSSATSGRSSNSRAADG